MRPETSVGKKWLRAPLIALGAMAMLLGATATAEAQINGIASQMSVDFLEGKLDTSLDVTVSSRASQASVDALDTSNLDATVSSRASQASVDALDTSNLDATVSSRASQTSVDLLEGKVDASLDATVSSRASQMSVDVIESKLDAAAATTSSIDENFGALVEKVIAMKKIDLKVIVLRDARRFLLVASEAGVPVDVDLISVKVANAKNNNPLNIVDVTVDAIATVVGAGTGILDVSLVKDANLFQFTVSHDDGTDPVLGPIEHFGTATVFNNSRSD